MADCESYIQTFPDLFLQKIIFRYQILVFFFFYILIMTLFINFWTLLLLICTRSLSWCHSVAILLVYSSLKENNPQPSFEVATNSRNLP